ncbi:hypothetical protein ACLK1G_12100 [Pseudomonas sp. NR3]|uniref:hypothetical protein n=1 Tax=Pseudomonas sp. NR3 TaxID=3155978 RepID=UPI003B66CE8F
MRYSLNGVTSMCCESHKSFRMEIFKPTESNFRAQTKNVADGHRDRATMKIQRKIFIAHRRLVALHSIPYHPHLSSHRFPGSRPSTGAQSGKP